MSDYAKVRDKSEYQLRVMFRFNNGHDKRAHDNKAFSQTGYKTKCLRCRILRQAARKGYDVGQESK